MSFPFNGTVWTVLDSTGAPVPGAKVYTYAAGTLTAKAAYTTSALTTATSNPIIADSSGRVQFFLGSGSYRIRVFDASDVEITALACDNMAGSQTTETVVSLAEYGAVGDGSTDDSIAIAAALSAASAAGGGEVVFLPGNNYYHASTLTLPSNVVMRGYGATLTYGGSAIQIDTAATGITSRAGIHGLTIDGGASVTSIVKLRSAYACSLRDLQLKSNSATCTVIDLAVNASGSTNADGNRNTVFNTFDNLLQDGICGTGVKMTGDVTVPTVITLNTFSNFNARGISVRGIDFAAWCDSNYFSGITRLQVVANSGVGVEWNSSSPTSNVGVYANNFDHLAVDTFGTMTGRVGAKMNLTKLNRIGYFFQEPVAEGGDLVVSPYCYGYDITHAIGGTNYTARRTQGSVEGYGGSYSSAYCIYTNSYTLTGTNPASVLVADTFPSTATGSGAGLTVANQTAASAFTLAAYNAINVSNITKGAGSTVTYQVGLNIADLTSGTNNWGIRSQVTSGAGKFNLYIDGTAANYFEGDMQIKGGAQAILHTLTAVTSGAGASTGTLTNAPTAGNPTKWIPFNDAGTTRYIPAW